MSITGSVLGSLVFLVLAPGTVAVLVPWWITGWRTHPAFLGLEATRWAGLLGLALGAPVLLDSFARFALHGRGTPAPVLPTERLVVRGLFRYVRNPMYVAVVSVIVGQALWLASPALLAYAGLVWLAFHLFVLGYEEPTLHRQFGDEYDRYRAAVPRWLPRLTPWWP